jgi:hypothetical protein
MQVPRGRGNIKGKAVPQHTYEGARWETSALDGGEWSASCPGRALPPGKEPPVSIVEAGRAPEPVWTYEVRGKILCLCWGSNLDRSVVESVARLYTD